MGYSIFMNVNLNLSIDVDEAEDFDDALLKAVDMLMEKEIDFNLHDHIVQYETLYAINDKGETYDWEKH